VLVSCPLDDRGEITIPDHQLGIAGLGLVSITSAGDRSIRARHGCRWQPATDRV